jgi:hypothetical protein
MRSVLLLLGLTFSFSFMANAQNDIALQWEKSYGGSAEDFSWCVKQTSDGGYIISGKTSSSDGDVTGYHGGGSDYWVVKTDKSGTIQWQKTYGGSGEDKAGSVQQTTDGGYIIAGTTYSSDGDVTGFHGGYSDYWVVKTDDSGIIQWQKTYGGSGADWGWCIQQTTDGGYIIAGNSNSNDGDVTGNHGGADYWVVKTDPLGNLQWQKSYGGSGNDEASGIRQTLDGGYIVAGYSYSTNGDVTGNHGGSDFWIVKTDPSGTLEWQKSYGGSDNEENGYGIQQTIDGGYIIAGITNSTDGDVTGKHWGTDYWVVKTDPLGNIQWEKALGGSSDDAGLGIEKTVSGDFIIVGWTMSNDGDVTGNHGGTDYWAVKTNPSGIIQWQRTFGGWGEDWGMNIQATSDGGFILTGMSNSIDGDVTGNHGNSDYWIVKLCQGDPLSISISDTSYCYSTLLTATAGFSSYLWNTGDTTQTIEVDTGGVYHVKATNLSGCPSEETITVPAPILPYSGEQICMVTLDSISGKNVIVIEKTLNVGTDSLHIYRMDNLSSLYKKIGSIGVNEPGIFTDNDAIPAQQSYQYKISVKDTCGRESGLSAMHRTILLQANTGINHEVNLFWNPYEGFEYSTFEIYRRNITRGDFILIANVPNTTYAFTDLTPPSGTNLYQVRVSKDLPCVPTKTTYSHVISNTITSSNIGIGENQEKTFTIHPNPASNLINIEISTATVEGRLSLMNPNGQEILTCPITGTKTQLDISGLPRGVYFVRLTNDKTVEVRKFIRQ